MRIAATEFLKNIALFFIDSRYRKFIWLSLKLGFTKRYTETSTSISGLKFQIPDALSFLWQYHEIFYSESYKFKPKNVNPVIFDCGANVGTSVMYFRKHYPSAVIKAFEPDKKIFSYLEHNILNNKIKDIELFNAAVWKENTTLNFAGDGADGGQIDTKNKGNTDVQAIRLKDLLEKEKSIDLLKIDIEGAEYEVFEDCKNSLSRIHNIFVECHSFLNNAQEIHKILNIFHQNGFRYFIQNESNRTSPFYNKKRNADVSMDMQLNIFAYK